MKTKKLIALSLAAVTTLSLAACGQKTEPTMSPAAESVPPAITETTPTPLPEETAPIISESDQPTEEEVIAEAINAAELLFEQLTQYAGTDYERFSALFVNTPQETIDGEFNVDYSAANSCDNLCSIVIVHTDTHFLVNLVPYIVAGQYPNTHRESMSFFYYLTMEDGKWYFDFSEEAVTALNALTENNPKLFPAAILEAVSAGRNCIQFGYDYMYLSDSAVFNGHSESSIKFAWQNEDGSVTIGIFIANGTDQNIAYASASIALTDDDLGEILSVDNVAVDTIVRAKHSTIATITIPAMQVITGTQIWGSVHSHISIRCV